ncbi:MAG TPA: GNAT family N-acetyltransferase, partial [Clostridia bacterium]|nr:GNAT family N-acetyltransferase [Clostridia bacterium]
TDALTLVQKIRRELNTTYIQCLHPALVPINQLNVSEVLRLKPAANQECYVATNAVSIAQAFIAKNISHPYALEERGIPVGFVMFYADKKNRKYTLSRFMVDASYQGKGFGRVAMELVIKELKKYGASKVELSVVPDNTTAVHVYESAGFKFTGKTIFDVAFMELEL